MARTSKAKIVKRTKAAARKVTSKVVKAAKRETAAARKTKAKVQSKIVKAATRTSKAAGKAKSKIVKAVKRERTVAQKVKSRIVKVKNAVARKLRGPSTTEVLSTDLKKIGSDLSTLGGNLLKLSQQTVGNEIESVKQMGRDLLESAAKKV